MSPIELLASPAALAVAGGLLSTVITSLATRPSWPSGARRWFALGVVVVTTALCTLAARSSIDPGELATMLAMAAGVCQGAYTVLHSLGISQWIERLTERPEPSD